MAKSDIAHAITVNNKSSGAVRLGLQDKTVSGPQKAIQSVIVQLLSSDGPLARDRTPFITILRQNNLRDKSRLNSVFRNFILDIVGDIDSSTRPDNERISDIALLDVSSLAPDSISLRIQVTLRSGDSTVFVMPVEL